jgi:hypothetical protein
VKKIFLPLSILCLTASMLVVSSVKADGNSKISKIDAKFVDSSIVENKEVSAEAAATILYENMGLESMGLSKDAMKVAYKGYSQLKRKGMLSNPDVLTIADFSQSSNKKRLYIIDIKNSKVLLNTYVAHGKNSGLTNAERFSNNPESLQSSLGFYVTKNTYNGKHGLSLKLSGLDKGFNNNAEARAIVVHGAAYIGDGRGGYMGRSWGCPAVPQELAPKVINMIKDGSTLFIYKPDQSYLSNSSVLNG